MDIDTVDDGKTMKRKLSFDDETSRKMLRKSESLHEREMSNKQQHLAADCSIENNVDSTSSWLKNVTMDSSLGTVNSNEKSLEFEIDQGLKLIILRY